MSVVMMVSATQRADMPTASFMLFRLLSLIFLIIDVVKGVSTGQWAGIEFWVCVLVAEYAATIRTVPPAELPERDAVKAEIGGRSDAF
jgi:hypothetical protein